MYIRSVYLIGLYIKSVYLIGLYIKSVYLIGRIWFVYKVAMKQEEYLILDRILQQQAENMTVYTKSVYCRN